MTYAEPGGAGPSQRLLHRRHRLWRWLSWRRRLMAALLAATAVVVGLQTLRPDPPPTVPVVVATRDLPPGQELSSDDLTVRELPSAAVPDAAMREEGKAAGRLLAGPMRAGEPLTDVRLVGRARLRAYGPKAVAAAVRVQDPALLPVLRVGDHVDVIAASTAPDLRLADPDAEVLVRSAPVLALPSSGDADAASAMVSTGGAGGVVLLAVSPSVATDLARAAVRSRLTLVLRGS